MAAVNARRRPLEFGIAAHVLQGSQASGDVAVVVTTGAGALFAAVDGLGHGEKAAQAAHVARTVIEGNSSLPLAPLLELCHRELRSTRGAVISMAAVDLERCELAWLGVGNVQCMLCSADPARQPARVEMLQRTGVVGAQLPLLKSESVRFQRGDLLVMATDGIHARFADDIAPHSDPERLAAAILKAHLRGDDDALVLVARLT